MPDASQPSDRRRVQRVSLPQPLRATLGSVKIFIVDLSLHGLRILHQDDIGTVGSSCVLVTHWDGQRIELNCRIIRTALHRAAEHTKTRTQYHSGLTLVKPSGASAETLRRLIEYHVERALDEQKANARGIPPRAAQSVQTGAPVTFVRHEYTRGQWREVMTPTAAQPESGFTISSEHSAAEVEMLRRAYERAATNADRATIRKLAALSVSSSDIVQARRYLP
jgi:hypothetical protein